MTRGVRASMRTLLVALACAAPPLHAEQFVRAGRFEIHYNAFHADAVPAEVAAAHGIARSRKRALVNVTVLAPQASGLARAAEATVSGSVTNLSGQRQPLVFRAVREAEALYYLAEFPIAGEDRYRFTLAVRPAGASREETIRFEQPLVGR